MKWVFHYLQYACDDGIVVNDENNEVYLDSRFWRPPRAPIHIPQPAVTTARTPTTLRWTFYNWVGLHLIGAIGFALLLTTPTSIVLMGIGIHPEHKADQRYSRLTIIIFALFKFKVPNFKQFLWNIGTGNNEWELLQSQGRPGQCEELCLGRGYLSFRCRASVFWNNRRLLVLPRELF